MAIVGKSTKGNVGDGLIRIEQIKGEKFGVVDYISGQPEVRFTGTEWMCLSFVVGLISPVQLAKA